MRLSYRIERLLLAVGLLLCGAYGVVRLHSSLGSRMALRSFEELRVSAASGGTPAARKGPSRVDYSLWSPKRVTAYQASLKVSMDPPLAALQIPRFHLEVPVFAGIDELVLNRGAGWIPGTARPGEPGNVGIAGHRDGFFRGLKDITLGDTIALVTIEGTSAYTVDEIEVVNPDDASVLADRPRPGVTLVTCYPFYFIGDAPQRYIVHASMKEPVRDVRIPNPKETKK
jgi:sortase A